MHPLELVLQLQVGSDQTAVVCLPSIISSLTPSHFEPSPHLPKWTRRVTSLIQSKHPGARWAGLCLAFHTSALSKDFMMESAQHWIAITLPMLSRNETPPTLKACIRLLEFIFSSAINLPEFQRQLATPNVPKFSAALLGLAEKSQHDEIRHISLVTLTHLIPIYPTLYRQLHPSILSLSFHLLSGSSATPTPPSQVTTACNLHGVLHFTGGKVGAAPLWRKSLDKALANAWSALVVLRATYPELPRSTLNEHSTFDFPEDPVVAIPLGIDRLRCSMSLINHLLRAVTPRAVPVPIGELNRLALCLLRCELDEKMDTYFDPSRRALEISVLPAIWKMGCEFITQLSKTLQHKLTPYLSRISSLMVLRLEKSLPKPHRVWFLRPLPSLLSHTYILHSPTQADRIVKVLLPLLTTLLPRKSEMQCEPQGSLITSTKGKKRARGYEGDEVFKVGRDVLCPTSEDAEAVDLALEALKPLLFNPHLSVPVRTLTARLLMTLLYELPRYSPSMFSPDLSFQGHVHAKVLSIWYKCVLAGPSGWINSAIGLIVNAMGVAIDGNEAVSHSLAEAQRAFDLLLHPRLPPLLRPQPAVEELSLLRSERTRDDEVVWAAAGLSRDNMQSIVETITEPTALTVETQSHSAAPQQLWSTRETLKAPRAVVEGPDAVRLLGNTRSGTITDQTLPIEKSSIVQLKPASVVPQQLVTRDGTPRAPLVATSTPANEGLTAVNLPDKTQSTTGQTPSSVTSSIQEIVQPKPGSTTPQQSSTRDETSRTQLMTTLTPPSEGLNTVNLLDKTQSTTDQTSSIVKSLIQDIVQKKVAFAPEGQDSDSDEEMPEIDMRSDSD